MRLQACLAIIAGPIGGIAATVALTASSTGTTLVVDGGTLAGAPPFGARI